MGDLDRIPQDPIDPDSQMEDRKFISPQEQGGVSDYEAGQIMDSNRQEEQEETPTENEVNINTPDGEYKSTHTETEMEEARGYDKIYDDVNNSLINKGAEGEEAGRQAQDRVNDEINHDQLENITKKIKEHNISTQDVDVLTRDFAELANHVGVSSSDNEIAEIKDLLSRTERTPEENTRISELYADLFNKRNDLLDGFSNKINGEENPERDELLRNIEGDIKSAPVQNNVPVINDTGSPVEDFSPVAGLSANDKPEEDLAHTPKTEEQPSEHEDNGALAEALQQATGTTSNGDAISSMLQNGNIKKAQEPTLSSEETNSLMQHLEGEERRINGGGEHTQEGPDVSQDEIDNADKKDFNDIAYDNLTAENVEATCREIEEFSKKLSKDKKTVSLSDRKGIDQIKPELEGLLSKTNREEKDNERIKELYNDLAIRRKALIGAFEIEKARRIEKKKTKRDKEKLESKKEKTPTITSEAEEFIKVVENAENNPDALSAFLQTHNYLQIADMNGIQIDGEDKITDVVEKFKKKRDGIEIALPKEETFEEWKKRNDDVEKEDASAQETKESLPMPKYESLVGDVEILRSQSLPEGEEELSLVLDNIGISPENIAWFESLSNDERKLVLNDAWYASEGNKPIPQDEKMKDFQTKMEAKVGQEQKQEEASVIENKEVSIEEKEKIKDQAREKFITAYKEYLKTRSFRERVGFSKKEEDWPKELRELSQKYRNAKVDLMKVEYNKKKEEVYESMPDMSKQESYNQDDVETAMKENERMNKEYFNNAVIFKDIELKEREEIHRARVEAIYSEKEQQKKLHESFLEWYGKRSLISRAAITTAAFTAAYAGMSTAGAVGVAGYAGYKLLRSVAGGASGMFFGKVAGHIGDGVVKIQENWLNRRFDNTFSAKYITDVERQYQRDLDSLNNTRKKVFIAKVATAMAGGYLAAGPGFSKILEEFHGANLAVPHDVPNGPEKPQQPPFPRPEDVSLSSQGPTDPNVEIKDISGGMENHIVHPQNAENWVDQNMAPHSEGVNISNSENSSGLIHEVKSGDNLWDIIKEKIGGQMQEHKLEAGQRTYSIDELKDRFARMSPEELKGIGISSGDINDLKPGDKIDLTKILGGEAGSQNINHAILGAEHLSQDQMHSIESHDKALNDFYHTINELHAKDPNVKIPQLDEEMAGKIINGYTADQYINDINNASEQPTIVAEPQDQITTHDTKEIFKGQYSEYAGEQGKEGISAMKAEDVIKGSFSIDHYGKQMDMAELGNRNEITHYLNQLQHDSNINPEANETVADYIQRASGEIEKISATVKADLSEALSVSPKDPNAIANFIQKYTGELNKDFIKGISSEFERHGNITKISFDIPNNAADVKLIITDSGKIAVDGYGWNNWPDGAKILFTKESSFANLTPKSLEEAVKFITSGKAIGK